MSDPAPRDVLVVGAGLAGAQVVAGLREAGFDGRVRVLGAEGLPPYDRPPLSKHLLDRAAPAWLSDEIGVDLSALADEVHLDRPARALLLGDARPAVRTDVGDLAADHVVLATGARAVQVPGWEAALTLHTVADAERLRASLVPGARLVVIGAGWIGAEVATVAAKAGHEVAVVEAAATPLSAALGEAVGALTTPWYDEAGVRLLTGATVTRVRADGVALADGRRVAADVVLAAVGARPATGWLAGVLPLEADGSVTVDASYRVLTPPGVPGVWAVGDVARRWSPRHGPVPGGHWDGALRGPRALVGHLLDQPPAPGDADPAPYVFSTQLGHELAMFGLPQGRDVVLRGDPASGEGWAALWYSGERVVAVLVVDRPRDVGAARRLFAGGELPLLDRAAAANPAHPLRARA